MSSRHFINDATVLVNSALQSLTMTNPNLGLDEDNKIVYRRPGYGPSQVSLVSGGGSGHEPSFGALVGTGLLSGAVAGTIFASPSAEQIRRALTSRIDNSQGILVVVMNYTGDVLNFGMAVENTRAAGIQVEMLVVGDDVGVGRTKGGKVGRRGIAGTVLVDKIAGALAARGAPLSDVYKVAKLTADNLVSVGASLEHVHVPGRLVESEDRLAPGEVEIGMGIHNEDGSARAKVELPALVSTMLAQLLDPNDKDRAFVNVNSNEVVLLVNNLGGVSPLEMAGITAEVVKQLSGWNVRPVRVLSGTFMTSLNGLGFSISLLNVVNTNIGGPGMIELLDDPCEATGWSAPISKGTWEARNTATRENGIHSGSSVQKSSLKVDAGTLKTRLTAGLEAVIAAEPYVTRYDTLVGDGDCGIGLKRGAEAILKHLETPLTGDVLVDVASIVPVVEMAMDGTSGALFSIFLNALVHSLQAFDSAGEASPEVWAGALKQSCDALAKYTPAQPGDRTIVDALHPFVETLGRTGDVKVAAETARDAALATKGMEASLGRAVYVGGSAHTEVPDPGAWGLACFFMGLADVKPKGGDWAAV